MSSRKKIEPQIIVDLDPMGWVVMTRDMELIRKIISAIQARKDAAPEMGGLFAVELRVRDCKKGFVFKNFLFFYPAVGTFCEVA